VVTWEHARVVDLSNSKFFIMQLLELKLQTLSHLFLLSIIRDKAEEIIKFEGDYFGRGFE
jgi:hypothetical protein